MNKVDSRNSILLLVDGLRPSNLGPYGNTWFDTTQVNQLASESMLFEQCISDSPDIQLGVRGILSGIHACNSSKGFSLPEALAQKGAASTLVTGNVAKFSAFVDSFSHVVEIEMAEPTGLADDLPSTQMANFFATALESLGKQDEPGMLVLDCPGFTQYWDAPYALREELADPEDPIPTKLFDVPGMQFNPTVDDPDQLLDFQVAYSGQVRIFDDLLEVALNQIDQSGWGRRALLCLASTRGFPMGEHGVVGYYRPTLHNECTQVPLLVRWPTYMRKTGRSQQIVQPGSLCQLLAEWHKIETDACWQFPSIDPGVVLPSRSGMAAVIKCEVEGVAQHAIQTAVWKYMSGSTRQLFVKPDDIWEFNDVVELCSQVAEELQLLLDKSSDELSEGQRPVFELPDVLALGIE